MKIDIMPADMKTVTIRLREREGYIAATIAIPPELIKRKELKDGDNIVIGYICKADEDPKFG